MVSLLGVESFLPTIRPKTPNPNKITEDGSGTSTGGFPVDPPDVEVDHPPLVLLDEELDEPKPPDVLIPPEVLELVDVLELDEELELVDVLVLPLEVDDMITEPPLEPPKKPPPKPPNDPENPEEPELPLTTVAVAPPPALTICCSGNACGITFIT